MNFRPRRPALWLSVVSVVIVASALAAGLWNSARSSYVPYYLHQTRVHSKGHVVYDSVSIRLSSINVNDSTNLAVLIVEPVSRVTSADVIMVHGYRSSKEAMLAGAAWLSRRGVTVWLPDLRAHGESDGTYTTLGAREHRELLVMIDSILHWNHDRPIALWGNSMGGATVLLAAAHDQRIDLCVSESAFADVHTLLSGFIDHEFPGDLWLKRWLGPYVIANELDLTLGEADPVDVISRISCPLALVHGTSDTRVPYDHALRLFHASHGHAKLITIPNGTHYALRKSAPSVYDRGLGPMFDALMQNNGSHGDSSQGDGSLGDG